MAIVQRRTVEGGDAFSGRNNRRRRAPRRLKREHRLFVRRVLLYAVVVLWIAVIVAMFVWFPDATERKLQLPSHANNKLIQYIRDRSDSVPFESPLLVITYNRPNYLKTTLEHIFQAMTPSTTTNQKSACGFGCPIIVSEDGAFEANKDLLASFQEKFRARGIPLIHIQHKQPKHRLKGAAAGYKALAQHFGWALSQVFDGTAYNELSTLPKRVIVLEEDIRVAPDFFSYMEATSGLLDTDPTLLAVSAFNDNGHLEHGDPKRLLRSDFFPGLGWMITRNLWKNELQSKWPDGYWDDWIRDRNQRKDRQVIRPEVSRTYHFGSKGGTSGNQFGSILERVKLNKETVDWETEDLSYLENSAFQTKYKETVRNSKLVYDIEEAEETTASSNARMEYTNLDHFRYLASELDIMTDEKDAVPRTAYRGIVEVRFGSNFLFLVPKGGFHGYTK